jgi:hypothetical protein
MSEVLTGRMGKEKIGGKEKGVKDFKILFLPPFLLFPFLLLLL